MAHDPSSLSSSDQRRLLLQHRVVQLIARLWTDSALTERLIADPRPVLTEADIPLPADAEVVALQDTATIHHLVLPPPDHPRRLVIERAADAVRARASFAIETVEDSPSRVHFVVPAPPAHVDLTDLDEAQVVALAVMTSVGAPPSEDSDNDDAGSTRRA